MPQFLQRPQAPAVPLREGTPQDETWLDKAVDLFTGLVGIPNPQSAAQQASGGPLSNPRAIGEMVGAASPIVGMALKRAIKGAKALPLAIQQALPFEGGHQIVPEAKKFLPWLKQYLNLRQMTEDRLSGGLASDAVRQLFFANEQQQRLPGLREEFSRAGLAVPDDNELLWLDAEMKAPKPTKQPEALPRSPHAFDLPEGAREQLGDEFPGLDLGPTASRETPEDIARGDAIEEINRQFLNGDISEDAYRDQLDQAMPPLSGEISIYRPGDPTEAENLLRAEVVDSPFYGPVERRQADYPWKHQESLFGHHNGGNSEAHQPALFSPDERLDAVEGYDDSARALARDREELARRTMLAPGNLWRSFAEGTERLSPRPEKGYQSLLGSIIREHQLVPEEQSLLQRAYKGVLTDQMEDHDPLAGAAETMLRYDGLARDPGVMVDKVRPAFNSLLQRSALAKALLKKHF